MPAPILLPEPDPGCEARCAAPMRTISQCSSHCSDDTADGAFSPPPPWTPRSAEHPRTPVDSPSPQKPWTPVDSTSPQTFSEHCTDWEEVEVAIQDTRLQNELDLHPTILCKAATAASALSNEEIDRQKSVNSVSQATQDSGSGNSKNSNCTKKKRLSIRGKIWSAQPSSPKPLARSQTGLSSTSYHSWSSSISRSDIFDALHSTSSTAGQTAAVFSQYKDNLMAKVLGSGLRQVENIDEWIGTVISDVDELKDGERYIHFAPDAVNVAPHKLNAQKGKQPNRVRTAKFTMMTWLPISLYMQFKRVANRYFLVIAVIVMLLGEWSPKDWRSKVFPFACVLLWTALKDLFEDRRRKADDHIENTTRCLRFDVNIKKFVSMPWQDLLVGDVLFLRSDETIPADLVLLATEACRDAYTSTASLDGEINLKKRRLPAIIPKIIALQPTDVVTRGCEEDQAMSFLYYLHVASLGIHMAPPTVPIWDVKGKVVSIDLPDEEPCPLSEVSFLPRGCVLRNTPWALAVVCFVGEETKIRLNSAKPNGKFSQMQHALNSCVWGLLAGLVAICLYSATLSVSLNDEDEASFCCTESSWAVMFLKYMVTFYHVVPLSLYVCFEMLKLVLGFAINVDKQMYDPVTQKGAVARTADLVEEMGQVEIVFSDKTGTLTANEMVFARCSIAGHDLGEFRRQTDHLDGQFHHQISHQFSDACKPDGLAEIAKDEVAEGVVITREILEGEDDEKKRKVQHFFTCLAVCHGVQVETKQELACTEYAGISPDEIALVQAACDVGIVFEAREERSTASSVLRIQGLGTRSIEVPVLHELEFNSDRKRMSVIVKIGDVIMCITKGADSAMEELLAKPLPSADAEALRRFSTMGLRTLVVASKTLGRISYNAWEKRYLQAQGVMDDTRAEKLAELAALMESGLEFVGVTAVEDRLQQDVPAAINTIKLAGMQIWVLTGDKMETAVDIARSCLLFSEDCTIAYATKATSALEAQEVLLNAKATLAKAAIGGLVIDGPTVQQALASDRCCDLIYELGLEVQSCLCCRLSPKQKKQLIELVQQRQKGVVTLSIGDGANDVPMLQGANIGIGVRGKEGAQAIQVADVAISEFRFLVPLLLCHGRRSYWRVALFLNYYLYKSMLLAMGDLIWMHQNEFTGGVAFPEYLSVNYNVLFTSWHIVLVLAFDYGVSDTFSVEHPELYLVGVERRQFNRKVFSVWMIRGVVHGCIAWLLPNLWYGGTYYDDTTSHGAAENFWVCSCGSFCTVVVIAMSKLLLELQRPLAVTALLPTLLAFLMLLGVLFLLGYTSIGIDFQPNLEDVPAKMVTRVDARAAILLSICGALAADVVERAAVAVACPRRM